MRCLRLTALAFAGTALAVAACGSSSTKTAATTAPPSTTGSAGASGATAGPNAAVTIKTANVPMVGTVLVNGNGRTFYLLTSEKGGKLTCSEDNGCTAVWPDTKLPDGMSHAIASGGAQVSLLGTVRSKDGDLYVTYGGYPLYLFSGDSGPGQAKGQGIVSFGGTWWAISPAGLPVTASASSSTPTSSSGSSGNGGY